MSVEAASLSFDQVFKTFTEAGPNCLESAEEFNATLGKCQLTLINEEALAAILASLIAWINSDQKELFLSHAHLARLVEDVVSYTQNLGSPFNWKDVIRNLDHPTTTFRSLQSISVPILAYKVAHSTNDFVAISAFWDPWTNKEAQFAFLNHAIHAPKALIDLSIGCTRVVLGQDILPPTDTSIAQAYGQLSLEPWNNLDLVEVCLNNLVEDESDPAYRLFIDGLDHDPELLFLGMLHLLPFKNSVHEKHLFDLYRQFAHQGERGFFPFSINWAMNSASLLAGFRSCLQTSETYTGRILDTCEHLKILAAIYLSSDYPLALPIMCLAHKRGRINLQHWIEDRFEESSASFFNEAIKFLNGHVEQLAPYSECEGTDLLTCESAAVFFQILPQDRLSATQNAELDACKTSIIQRFPNFDKLLQHFVQQDLVFLKIPADIEDETNNLFEQMYAGQYKPNDLISQLVKYRTAPQPRDQVLYASAFSLILDEYHHLENYPDSELETTAVLVGQLVAKGVLTYSYEKIIITCIINSFNAAPGTQNLKFAITATFQFKARIPSLPAVLEFFRDNPKILATLPDLQPYCTRPNPKLEPEVSQDEVQFEDVPAVQNGDETRKQPPPATFEKPQLKPGSRLLSEVSIDTLLQAKSKTEYTAPDHELQEKIVFIINNLSSQNVEEKAKEIRSILDVSTFKFFSNYVVVKRVSTETNNHSIYLQLLDLLNIKDLQALVLEETYTNINILLKSEKTATSDQERALLKSLGSWLGSITLAKNKPILHDKLSIKDLLINGYIANRHIVVIPFTCKVLIMGRLGEVFKPPNPWLMGILRLLVELSKSPGLKTNTIFEIEVLIRAFNLKPDEIQPSVLLRNLALQNSPKERDPNSQIRSSLERDGEVITIQNVLSHVFLDPLLGFTLDPRFRDIALIAFDQALGKVATTVISKAVKSSAALTKELITKDFAMESNEDKMRRSALQMGQTVAASFAGAASKELFRNEYFIILKSMILDSGLAFEGLRKEEVEYIVDSNVRVAVMAIQSLALDAVVNETDSALYESFNNRKKSRERNGQPFYDMAVYNSGNYPTNLPDILKIKPSGLTPAQMVVYEDFLRLPLEVPSTVAPPENSGSYPRPGMAPQGMADENVDEVQFQMMLDNYAALLNELDRQVAQMPDDLEAHELEHYSKVITSLSNMLAQFLGKDDLLFVLAQKYVHRIFRTKVVPGIQIYTTLLGRIMMASSPVYTEVRNWLHYADDERKYVPSITKVLLATNIMDIEELDAQLGKLIEMGRGEISDYAVNLMKKCLTEDQLVGTFDNFKVIRASLLSVARLNNTANQVRAFLDDIKAQYENKFEEREFKATCNFYYSEWMRIYQHSTASDKDFCEFVFKLAHHGILNSNRLVAIFIRTSMGLTLDVYNRQLADNTGKHQSPYFCIDALAKMIIIILVYAQDPNDDHLAAKSNLFINTLTVIALIVLHDHHTKESLFNAKPYFRLYSSIIYHLHGHEESLKPIMPNLLLHLNNSLAVLRPELLPGFAFSWVSLVSHRLFLPKLIALPDGQSWQHVQTQLAYLFKFLHTVLAPPVSRVGFDFYTGVLRLMAAMMKDYPQFLVTHHFGLCVELPMACVQIKNMILSCNSTEYEYPRPCAKFYSGEVNSTFLVTPPILSDYSTPLKVKGLDEFVRTHLKDRDSIQALSTLRSKLCKDEENQDYDTLLINCLVMYTAIADLAERKDAVNIQSRAAFDIYQQLLLDLQPQGRFIFIDALFSNLRYPNLHTHYFSQVILALFLATNDMYAKEQIIRALVDRIISKAPVPWGVWCLLIDIFEDNTYQLRELPFIKAQKELLDFMGRCVTRNKGEA